MNGSGASSPQLVEIDCKSMERGLPHGSKAVGIGHLTQHALTVSHWLYNEAAHRSYVLWSLSRPCSDARIQLYSCASISRVFILWRLIKQDRLRNRNLSKKNVSVRTKHVWFGLFPCFSWLVQRNQHLTKVGHDPIQSVTSTSASDSSFLVATEIFGESRRAANS